MQNPTLRDLRLRHRSPAPGLPGACTERGEGRSMPPGLSCWSAEAL